MSWGTIRLHTQIPWERGPFPILSTKIMQTLKRESEVVHLICQTKFCFILLTDASGRCTPVCATPSSTPRKNRTRPSSAPPTKTYSAASIKSYGSDVSSPVPSSVDIPVSYSSMEIRSPTPTPTRHSRRPSSAAPSTNYRVKLAPDTPEPGRNSYRKQVVVTSPAPSRNQKNQSVQTPNAFKTTLQPALDWPHKTLTYSEMKRLLRERRIMIARPQWRP